jgi:hypothetical protein
MLRFLPEIYDKVDLKLERIQQRLLELPEPPANAELEVRKIIERFHDIAKATASPESEDFHKYFSSFHAGLSQHLLKELMPQLRANEDLQESLKRKATEDLSQSDNRSDESSIKTDAPEIDHRTTKGSPRKVTTLASAKRSRAIPGHAIRASGIM